MININDNAQSNQPNSRLAKVNNKCAELRSFVEANSELLIKNKLYDDLLFSLDRISFCALEDDAEGVLVQTNYIITELRSLLKLH